MTSSTTDQHGSWPSTTSIAVTFLPLRIITGNRLELNSLQISGEDEELLLPYKRVDLLGPTQGALVEKVRNVKSGKLYARKTSTKRISLDKLAQVNTEFREEIKIMQRLAAHEHFVRLHASIILGRKLIMIIEPVASYGDLTAYLRTYRLFTPIGLAPLVYAAHAQSTPTRALHEAFGCLASGLLFMHDNNIRHKDIKPENILVHQKDPSSVPTCLYTDFGLSSDYSNDGISWTTGAPKGSTPKYRAPEVTEWERRGPKSDVFSLGCVYIEIGHTLSKNWATDDLLDGIDHEKLASLLLHGFHPPLVRPLEMVLNMVRPEPSTRLSAKQVVRMLLDRSYPKHFCRTCLSFETTKAEQSESATPNLDVSDVALSMLNDFFALSSGTASPRNVSPQATRLQSSQEAGRSSTRSQGRAA